MGRQIDSQHIPLHRIYWYASMGKDEKGWLSTLSGKR